MLKHSFNPEHAATAIIILAVGWGSLLYRYQIAAAANDRVANMFNMHPAGAQPFGPGDQLTLWFSRDQRGTWQPEKQLTAKANYAGPLFAAEQPLSC